MPHLHSLNAELSHRSCITFSSRSLDTYSPIMFHSDCLSKGALERPLQGITRQSMKSSASSVGHFAQHVLMHDKTADRCKSGDRRRNMVDKKKGKEKKKNGQEDTSANWRYQMQTGKAYTECIHKYMMQSEMTLLSSRQKQSSHLHSFVFFHQINCVTKDNQSCSIGHHQIRHD